MKNWPVMFFDNLKERPVTIMYSTSTAGGGGGGGGI